VNIEELLRIAGKKTEPDDGRERSRSEGGGRPLSHAALIEQSVAYLASDEALKCMEDDPYWPKWSSPWWQMLLLFELGQSALIPQCAIEKMLTSFDRHYLKFFPFAIEDIPAGLDPVRHIVCHCALASMHQVLNAAGVDLDERLPWVRPWYLRYQLEDGGLNCDEAAYTRPVRKSSVVATVPPLEAVLHCTGRDFTAGETALLDRGANYLLERKLIRSATTGSLIDESWLQLCFPRFYHYDQLRGLSLVLNWAFKLKRSLPLEAVAESVALIDAAFPDGRIRVQRNACSGENSVWLDQSTGRWIKAPAGTFPLLDQLSKPGTDCPRLTREWSSAKATLRSLVKEGLLQQS
jgi:hypothetical protein